MEFERVLFRSIVTVPCCGNVERLGPTVTGYGFRPNPSQSAPSVTVIVPPDAIGEVVGDVGASGKLSEPHAAFAAAGRNITAAISASHADRARPRRDRNIASAAAVIVSMAATDRKSVG